MHRLLDLSDQDTELALLSGFRWYDDGADVLASVIVSRARIDQFTPVAKAVAQLLAYGPKDVHWDRVPPATQSELITKLGDTPDISDYGIQKLLADAAVDNGPEVLTMLRGRVEKAVERGKSYQALPYHWHDGPRFRAALDYPVLVRDLAVWMTEIPRGLGAWWAPKLFALVAGPYDEEIQRLTITLVRDGTDAAVRGAATMLAEAPQEYGMHHPAFVAEILDAARAVGADAERRIGGALYAATMFGMRTRGIGEFDADLGRAQRARELAASFLEGSSASRFYIGIAEASEHNARRDKQQDEDLVDPRRW